jgi:uncharacterized protein (DUF2147 family)
MSGNSIARVGSVILLTFCLLVTWQAQAESRKGSKQKEAQAEYKQLVGKWQRPDGGYILELSEVSKSGKLKAEYFNPHPINVSEANWRRIDDHIHVVVELQDVNYPGSTYKLIYSHREDRLEGYYYQAALRQIFDVVFVRTK